MAQNLGKLLGGDAKKRRALTELRQMTRDDSDVRLIAEILARAHSIIRSLGLDPSNATAEEIYQSLAHQRPKAPTRKP